MTQPHSRVVAVQSNCKFRAAIDKLGISSGHSPNQDSRSFDRSEALVRVTRWANAILVYPNR
jgi:hypothetical protein